MKNVFLFFFLSSGIVYSQNDSIHELNEIILHSNFSPVVNSGYQVKVLSDSLLEENYESLGNLLQNQANFYFKQNGNGMVSSISLRGTSAAQTGVFWNGIAINSSLNGQTDFNTLQVNGFDELEIRKGGGSVLLGSGAIGGAINLKDKLDFHPGKKAELLMGAGSFGTYHGQFKGVWSNQNLYAKIALGGQRSENDYPFKGTNLRNNNGDFSNYSINSVLGYKINEFHSLSIFGSFFNNDRGLSSTLTTTDNGNLKNKDGRFLLNWTYLARRFTSSLKTAVLQEEFNYLYDKDISANESYGKSTRIIGKYDLSYFCTNSLFLKAGLNWIQAKGDGTSLDDVSQEDLTGYFLLHHQPVERLVYNASLRAGISSAYSIPWIYSLDLRYKVSDQITVRSGLSTNYRLPTFNDLYWEPGGNPELRPEKSTSAEMGLSFNRRKLEINGTAFLIRSTDLIQWVPVSQDFWNPQNVDNATNYGFELSGNYRHSFGSHQFSLDLSYDFTRAIDEASDKQLIYVPKNKAGVHLNYRWKKWRAGYNLNYVGSVFITTSNSQELDPYWLSDLAINVNIINNRIDVGFRVNNLFDEVYQSVAYRPMPGRNFLIQCNLKL